MKTVLKECMVFLLIFGIGAFLGMAPAYGEGGPSIGQLFIDAYTKDNRKEMVAIIEKHKDGVPQEVRNMVEYALSKEVSSQDERDFFLMITKEMAVIFKEKIGDARLLAAVEANIQQVQGGAGTTKQPGDDKLSKVKEELVQLGKGEWNVSQIQIDPEGKIKIEIILKEKEASFSDRYVSFKDSKKAEEIVKKYLPQAKGRIDWLSGGMGMKAVILE